MKTGSMVALGRNIDSDATNLSKAHNHNNKSLKNPKFCLLHHKSEWQHNVLFACHFIFIVINYSNTVIPFITGSNVALYWIKPWQWSMQEIHHILNSQKTPHSLPWQATIGVSFCKYLRSIYLFISGTAQFKKLDCVFPDNICHYSSVYIFIYAVCNSCLSVTSVIWQQHVEASTTLLTPCIYPWVSARKT